MNIEAGLDFKAGFFICVAYFLRELSKRNLTFSRILR